VAGVMAWSGSDLGLVGKTGSPEFFLYAWSWEKGGEGEREGLARLLY
jgi:hypothetical protein